jgi:hypothetical protein
MRLIHYSNAPVKLGDLIARAQEEHGDMKPRGLWVSDEDAECDWKWWCVQEGFRLDMLTHVHEVTLGNAANVLVLKTASEVRAFGREFTMRHGPFAGGSLLGYHTMHLDWAQVIQRWHGLIITPYQWDCRLENDTFWYYSWDCASGCLWDTQAIGSIVLREIVEPPKPAYPREEQ